MGFLLLGRGRPGPRNFPLKPRQAEHTGCAAELSEKQSAQGEKEHKGEECRTGSQQRG